MCFWGLMFILSSAAGSLQGALPIHHGSCSWFLCPCVSPLTLKKTALCKPTGCYRRDWAWLLIKDLAASVLFSFGSLSLEEAGFHPVRIPKQFHGEVDARGKTTCQQPGQTCSVTQLRPTLCDPMDRSRSMGFSRPEYWSGLPFPSACRHENEPSRKKISQPQLSPRMTVVLDLTGPSWETPS